MKLTQLSVGVLEDVPGNIIITCMLSATTGPLIAKATGSTAYIQSAAIAAAIWFVVLMALTVRYCLKEDIRRREQDNLVAFDDIMVRSRRDTEHLHNLQRQIIDGHVHQWAYDEDLSERLMRRRCVTCGAQQHVLMEHLRHAPYGDVETLVWTEDAAAIPLPVEHVAVSEDDPRLDWSGTTTEITCDHTWIEVTSVGQAGRTELCRDCGAIRLDPFHGMDPESREEIERAVARLGTAVPPAPAEPVRLQPGAPIVRRRVIDISR